MIALDVQGWKKSFCAIGYTVPSLILQRDLGVVEYALVQCKD